MSEEEDEFRELLSCHGAQVTRWPDDVKHVGLEALLKPSLVALIEKEKHFEQLLHLRSMPASPRDLSQRIINRALTRRQLGVGGWLSEFRSEMKPAALAAMLALGFLIGFDLMTPTHSLHVTSVVSSADDDGAIL